MIIFFLEKLRKLFKSLGKFEDLIIDKLTILKNNSHHFSKVNIVKDENFENFNFQVSKKTNYPKKLVIILCFYYNEKKINILKKNIQLISSYNFSTDLNIITNSLSKTQRNRIKKLFKRKNKINLFEIDNLPDSNLLPWYSINLMKKKFENERNSHFMFLEDDILVSSSNICYWIYFRKILKKLNLIPAFIRYEKYKRNKYVIDHPRKIKFNRNPKIQTENNNYGFINSKFPYSGMFIMDRDLMREYLGSNAIRVDYSFNNKFLKSKYPIKELLNISYAYLNIPKGYYNRLLIPYNQNKQVFSYCLIEHADTKYSNSNKLKNLGLKKINIKELIC